MDNSGRMTHVAYIALGANLGDRQANIRAALEKLAQTADVKVTQISAPMENPAIGGPADSPSFLNAAAELETTLSATALLHRLLEIEREIGRVRREKWGPRPIDLDLLLYGNKASEEPGLTLPHPLMHQRRFVLEPLAQIAPDAQHPLLKRTIRELLADLDRSH
ncbi:MAG: folK 2 [Phycisphaerales bacterium]|nr:folK 2 [Phycisphaerales bacterium]